MRMAYIISASAVVEAIFGWPGLGSLLIFSMLSRDYILVLGTFYVYTIIVVFAVLATEILYARIDPRIVFK
jgi:peptide/nickel transport system permease protein